MQDEYSTYVELLCAAYRDVVSAFPAHRTQLDISRDTACIKQRFANEGVSFLTKTLPSFAKAIDTALAKGTTLQVPSFARRKGSKLPRFLGWLIGLVFSTDGKELLNADSHALAYIRTLLLMFYKLELPHTSQQEAALMQSFKDVDDRLATVTIRDPAHLSELKTASKLIARVLQNSDPRDILPSHGPGSVATGERNADKPYFSRYYTSMDSVYLLDEYFYLSPAHMSECLTSDGLTFRDNSGNHRPVEFIESGTAKVVLVPKDSRGPRLISMEPLEIQWIQQGQKDVLVKTIESSWITRGQVNFTLQSVNRRLAWYSSLPEGVSVESSTYSEFATIPYSLPKSRDLVTLDMKEASDRVSWALVAALFPLNWVECLHASRSQSTKLSTGEVIALNKFAPMGSAVCFPVEALVFWALAVASVYHANPDTKLHSICKMVWVYGDDIICERKNYPLIEQSLERVGLLLNTNKCCVQGSFRESCGFDAYKGIMVTPLRISQRLVSSLPGSTLMAYVSYSNEAHSRGLFELALTIEKIVQAEVPVPYTRVATSGVQFVRPDADVRALNRSRRIRTRFSRDLHFLEAYGPQPAAAVSSGHNVTYESYFVRSVSSLVPRRTAQKGKTPLIGGSSRLKASQYPVPHRTVPKWGWKQVVV